MGICAGDSGADLIVEISKSPTLTYNDVGHTWEAISDVSGILDVTGGDKQISQKRTYGKTHINLNRPDPLQISLDVVFEQAASSFSEFLVESYDGTTDQCFWLRWTYNGGATGALQRHAKVALISNPYVGGNPEEATLSKSMSFGVDENVIFDDRVA